MISASYREIFLRLLSKLKEIPLSWLSYVDVTSVLQSLCALLAPAYKKWPHFAEAHIKDTHGVNSIYDFFLSLLFYFFHRHPVFIRPSESVVIQKWSLTQKTKELL